MFNLKASCWNLSPSSQSDAMACRLGGVGTTGWHGKSKIYKCWMFHCFTRGLEGQPQVWYDLVSVHFVWWNPSFLGVHAPMVPSLKLLVLNGRSCCDSSSEICFLIRLFPGLEGQKDEFNIVFAVFDPTGDGFGFRGLRYPIWLTLTCSPLKKFKLLYVAHGIANATLHIALLYNPQWFSNIRKA